MDEVIREAYALLGGADAKYIVYKAVQASAHAYKVKVLD